MEDYDQFLSTWDYPMDFFVLRRKCKKSFKVHA